MEAIPAGGHILEFGKVASMYLECKVDGCVNRRGGQAGIGGHYGEVTFSLSIPNFCIDSTYAELFAVKQALLQIPAHHAHVRIGLDSFQALEHMAKDSVKYEMLLRDIKALTLLREGVVLQNIPNAGNKIADNLSRQAAGLRSR